MGSQIIEEADCDGLQMGPPTSGATDALLAARLDAIEKSHGVCFLCFPFLVCRGLCYLLCAEAE